MNPISQLPQRVLNAHPHRTSSQYQFERFRQFRSLRGHSKQTTGSKSWKMDATELVTGHFHYALTTTCDRIGVEEQVEVIVKAMPASGALCFLGLDPIERSLSILFDGLTETLEGTIVRMCLDNQQMDRACIQAAPGQSFRLWHLDDLQFTNYLVRVNMNGLPTQQFLIKLIR